MSSSIRETTQARSTEADRRDGRWNKETLAWSAMVAGALFILAAGAWEVREQNLRLHEQSRVAELAIE